MQTFLTVAAAAVPMVPVTDVGAQNGSMMNGGGWMGGWMGEYGGYWLPVLLLAVVGLVVWVAMQGRKK